MIDIPSPSVTASVKVLTGFFIDIFNFIGLLGF